MTEKAVSRTEARAVTRNLFYGEEDYRLQPRSEWPVQRKKYQTV